MKSNKFMKFMKDLGVINLKFNNNIYYTPEKVDVVFSELINRKIDESLIEINNNNNENKKNSRYVTLDQFIFINVEISNKFSNQSRKSDKLEEYLTKGLFNDLLIKIKENNNKGSISPLFEIEDKLH